MNFKALSIALASALLSHAAMAAPQGTYRPSYGPPPPSTNNVAPPPTTPSYDPPKVLSAPTANMADAPRKCVKWAKKGYNVGAAANNRVAPQEQEQPQPQPDNNLPINGTPDAPAPDASSEQEGLEIIPDNNSTPPPQQQQQPPPPQQPQQMAPVGFKIRQPDQYGAVQPSDLPSMDELERSSADIPVPQGLSAEEASMYRLHNGVRRLFGIRKMQWDDGLARDAKLSANNIANSGQCNKLVHQNLCPNNTPTGSCPGRSQGENLFWLGGNFRVQTSASDAFQAWYNEKDIFLAQSRGASDFGYYWSIDGKALEESLHFTQLVWDATYSFGCAASYCDGGSGYVYTCRYFTPGNFKGMSPFNNAQPYQE
ncbi:Cuticle-degrading protease [Chytridiales sp. JEL 0842]|nr:Cuticle-degrading protease [Chytridiales sp. JEL 0842]